MKIIYATDEGISIVHPTGELSLEEVIVKDVPAGTPYFLVEDSAIPNERIFRNAWELVEGTVVPEVNKAREIAHNIRRVKRAEEFVELDLLVTIPSEAQEAEKARQDVRDKYAALQTMLEEADSVDDFLAILNSD